MLTTIQIETTNICNARCVFCPVPGLTRKRESMSMDLFTKIIDDCRDMDPQPLEILPFLNGEPFADPLIFARIEYINKVLPGARVILYSNGNMLSPDKAKRLAELRIYHVNFSINAVTDAERHNLMGLSLTEAIKNIFYYKDCDPAVSLSASMILDPAYCSLIDAKAFELFWHPREVPAKIFPSGNWAGVMRPSFNTKTPCCRPKSQMTVLADGRVSLCCFDAEGKIVLGNLNNQTIGEVWEGGTATRYREHHAKGDRKGLALCENCTTI